MFYTKYLYTTLYIVVYSSSSTLKDTAYVMRTSGKQAELFTQPAVYVFCHLFVFCPLLLHHVHGLLVFFTLTLVVWACSMARSLMFCAVQAAVVRMYCVVKPPIWHFYHSFFRFLRFSNPYRPIHTASAASSLYLYFTPPCITS